MKTKMYTLILLTFISASLSAAPRNLITAVSNNGDWSSTSTWNLGRIPQNNDSIYIPAGYTVIFNANYTLNNIFITIGGTLNFNQNQSLTLDAASVVNILSGGTLTATHPTPNELLSIGGSTKYNGKNDGTLSGPVEATNMTGNSPSGFTIVTLPVNFVSFYANRGNGTVELVWNTGNENNNSHFEIERSTTGTTWETIGNVAAGTNPSDNSYAFTDEAAPTVQTQYRIRQVDLDGNFEYSKVVMVNGTNTAVAEAKIIASGKTVSILLGKASASRLVVRVISVSGQVLQQQSIESASSRIDLNVSAATTGIYVVQVTDGNQLSIAKEVML